MKRLYMVFLLAAGSLTAASLCATAASPFSVEPFAPAPAPTAAASHPHSDGTPVTVPVLAADAVASPSHTKRARRSPTLQELLRISPEELALIQNNPLLQQELKKPDTAIIGFIEMLDAKVVQNLSLLVAFSDVYTATASGVNTLSVSHPVANLRENGEVLHLKLDVAYATPIATEQQENTAHQSATATSYADADAEAQPQFATSRMNTQILLRRNQITIVGGAREDKIRTGDNGEKIHSTHNRLFWCLW